MDDVLDDLHRLIRRCDSAARLFERAPVDDLVKRLRAAAEEIGESWSGGWLGRQARIYKPDLQPRGPGDHFDTSSSPDAHFSRTTGEWAIFDYDAIVDAVYARAGLEKDRFEEITAAAKEAERTFAECRDEFVPLLDAVLAGTDDTVLRDLREKAAGLKDHLSFSDLVSAIAPRQFMGPANLLAEGRQVPPHIAVTASIVEESSYAGQCKDLGSLVRHAATYLVKRQKLKGRTVARTTGPVFIGHGRSRLWMELRDFLHNRLSLETIEFNSESTAGVPTQERLKEMLDRSVFAFLVMTGEDQHADGTRHARENVIHEVGLFQGRLDFRRAIILHEEGCSEFSNIVGLTTIRFPKDNIRAAFEDVRSVLERERIK